MRLLTPGLERTPGVRAVAVQERSQPQDKQNCPGVSGKQWDPEGAKLPLASVWGPWTEDVVGCFRVSVGRLRRERGLGLGHLSAGSPSPARPGLEPSEEADKEIWDL